MDQAKRQRRDYDRELKMEAVEMALSEEYTAAEVAENLGIPISNLRRWIRQYKNDAKNAFPGKGRAAPDQEEMRHLQRENARLRQERDILKKRWPSSRLKNEALHLYSGASRHVFSRSDVSRFGRLQKRVLRLAWTWQK